MPFALSCIRYSGSKKLRGLYPLTVNGDIAAYMLHMQSSQTMDLAHCIQTEEKLIIEKQTIREQCKSSKSTLRGRLGNEEAMKSLK